MLDYIVVSYLKKNVIDMLKNDLDKILLPWTEQEHICKEYLERKNDPDYMRTFDKKRCYDLLLSLPGITDDMPRPTIIYDFFEDDIYINRHGRYDIPFKHRHTFYEMLFVYEGKALNTVAGKEHIIFENELMVVPPNVEHSLFTTGVVVNILAKTSYINKINGIDIPGHWTIHVNDPMAYANGSYPTQYTMEIFGKDCKNIGNSENDGHGMMMLSMYNTWRNSGSNIDWIHKHYEYIREAADWIVWNFENPDISFMKDDVLYSESEGANWKGYSLYCNIPCYFGLRAYADMAKVAGYDEDAEEWYSYAERLKRGILRKFVTKEGIWDTSNDGYPRDPVLVSMMYYYGYDANDMDKDFLEISRKTYVRDISEVLKCGGYFAAYGTGYDHGVITQNALLTDNMKDASRLLENLSLVCHSPNHPNPFAVPECYAVDTEKNMVRRQGDLGNLIQMSEALCAYNLVIGVSPFDVESGVIKILPRLPEGWNIEVKDFPIENTETMVNIKSTHPGSSDYTVELGFENIDTSIKEIRYRLGPFPMETKKIYVNVNGRKMKLETFESGDSKWAWLLLDSEENSYLITVSYGSKGRNNNLVAITIPLVITTVVVSTMLIYLNLKLKGRKNNV